MPPRVRSALRIGENIEGLPNRLRHRFPDFSSNCLQWPICLRQDRVEGGPQTRSLLRRKIRLCGHQYGHLLPAFVPCPEPAAPKYRAFWDPGRRRAERIRRLPALLPSLCADSRRIRDQGRTPLYRRASGSGDYSGDAVAHIRPQPPPFSGGVQTARGSLAEGLLRHVPHFAIQTAAAGRRIRQRCVLSRRFRIKPRSL